MAARLGPATTVFDDPPPPPVEFWVPLARRARLYLELALGLVRASRG